MQIFTTVHPGQREVCLMLYQGESPVASRNKLMGQFHLVGLPPAPIGEPQIEVSCCMPSLCCRHLAGPICCGLPKRKSSSDTCGRS